MYYDDTDARIDEYIISKHEKEMEQKEMLTVNYNDNVNNTNNNEVNEMSENKKVAVVFVNAKGRMSKPMMAVEDVADAVGTLWRDLYAKEDHPKSKTSKKGTRRLQTKTIRNPSHVKELGVASGKLAPRATYNKIYNIRGWNSEHHRKTKALFESAEVKYYDEVKKRIVTKAEVDAMANKNKVKNVKTIIEVDVPKPVVDKPVSLFSQEFTTPLEIKVDLNTDKRHPGFKESDGFTFEEYMTRLEQKRQEGMKRLIDDLRAFDWDDELPVGNEKERALEAIREAKQQIENAEKLLEQN